MVDHHQLETVINGDGSWIANSDRMWATTTTVHDNYLYGLSLTDELEPVIQLNPNWHIPFDVPTYPDEDMDPEVRRRNIENYILAARREAEILAEADCRTKILPLLKGAYPDEYRRCYNALKHLAGGYVAVYVGQLFGPKSGNQICRCRRLLWTIDAVCDPKGIILIGLASPRYLRDLPASVVGAAGRAQWLRATNYLSLSPSVARAGVRNLRNNIHANITVGQKQTALDQFNGVEIHG